MSQTIRNTILTAAALTMFAVPALADSVNCVVTAPSIRLRKAPSKASKVLAILKKDTPATAVGKCGGGWVKVTAKDGSLTGYVGGWALGEADAKAAQAPAAPAAPAKVELVKAEVPATVAAPKEVPTNEALAMQITELRLKVLGIDRDMAAMKKDLQKIKNQVARRSRHKQGKKG